MVLKITKTTENNKFYLVHNKSKSLLINDVEIGQCYALDDMFKNNKNVVFVEGYIDKKDRLIIKRKVEEQDW